jgi:hypothetical protein
VRSRDAAVLQAYVRALSPNSRYNRFFGPVPELPPAELDCVIVPARPGFIGSPGWVRSRAWIWLFSSTERTSVGRRVDIKADHVSELLGELRVVRQLELRMRCGASWWASRMHCTDRKLTPAAFASILPVQWVASPGGGPVTSDHHASMSAIR